MFRTNGATGRFTVQYFFKLEKVPRSTIVIQGDDLLLMCNLRQGVKIEGADVKFTWYTKPGDVEDPETVEGTELIPNTTSINDIEPHIKIIDRANNSVVKIEDAVYSDRAWYMCKVTNSHGQEAVMETLVRVKDKYAAVYPFIGILAEVIVLCFIIFICERRKTKSDEVEEEEEYNGNAAGGAGSSSLRRRN